MCTVRANSLKICDICIYIYFFYFTHTNNYNTLHLQFITGNCYRLQIKQQQKKHLHITTEKNLTSNHCLKLKGLWFSILKYIVLTFCWHSIASFFSEATLIEIGVYKGVCVWQIDIFLMDLKEQLYNSLMMRPFLIYFKHCCCA